MQKSEDISKLAAALAKAQPTLKTAKMDANNPFFKSKYADLGSVWDACRPTLESFGFSVSQLPDHAPDGTPALTTMLIHESGQWIAATYPLIVQKGDPQSFGSAITYARRYGLAAVLGIIADEDDDGNAASRPEKATQAKAPPPPPATAPKMTPAEWASKAVSEIKGLGLNALETWEAKNAAALVKLRVGDPAAHREIIMALQMRHSVLDSANAG